MKNCLYLFPVFFLFLVSCQKRTAESTYVIKNSSSEIVVVKSKVCESDEKSEKVLPNEELNVVVIQENVNDFQPSNAQRGFQYIQLFKLNGQESTKSTLLDENWCFTFVSSDEKKDEHKIIYTVSDEDF